MLNSQDKSTQAVQTILELERAIMEAIKEKDTEALSQIIADDFVHRTPGNADARKTDFLRNIASLSVKILAIWGEQLKVNVYGDVAVLTGVQQVKVKDSSGKEEAGAGVFTDVFVKRKGQWQMVLAHSVDLPATAS